MNRVKCTAILSFLTAAVSTLHAAPLDQPTPELVAEARRIVHEMASSPRGPYSRIRWYCNDGTVLPPVAYACRDHGGGRQHAEYSDKRQRLADLGWSVGTIYAALTFEDLFQSASRQQRLRELALEQYLVDIDNGWVLRGAQGYRGRVQVEDEDAAGRAILLQILADTEWVGDNFLLAREASRVIPHGEDTDLARSVRRAAVELAELDSRADRWRAEIHSTPSPDTSTRLRAWLRDSKNQALKTFGEQLARDLDVLYGEAGRRDRIAASLKALQKPAAAAQWKASVEAALKESSIAQIAGTCGVLAEARTSVLAQVPASSRLALVDAMQGLETEVQISFQTLMLGDPLSRADLMGLSRSLIDCAFGSGLLTPTEHLSLAQHLDVGDRKSLSLSDYRDAITRLKRAPAWAVGTIRHTFAEPLIRYTALDSRAARFSDDLLRSSPMWMLGDTLKLLSRDLDILSGSVVQMNGEAIASAVALNGGVATGTLRIFETIEDVEGATLEATDIVVLPETIAELSPIAGILTLGEGNALSHVQLLARNFGIPNVAINQDTVDLLRTIENSLVILVVDNDGNVLLRKQDGDTAAILASATSENNSAIEQITVPSPNLGEAQVLSLPQIRRDLSGKVIGPKAANLGELNYLFPGRVAPAIAIPFGIYAQHLDAAGISERVRAVFAGKSTGSISKQDFDAEVAEIRRSIMALQLSDATRRELTQAMSDAFGEAGSYGVFVRSDTNVEDLPQFTGAGLNETVPNVVGLEAQLTAIPRVWSSVFSPRALAWRSSVLANPDQIFASVLLMKSVPATKSGVLVTANLFDRGKPGLTASAAWGVGGAVAGEPAESVVIHENDLEVFSEAKSAYGRRLAESGGVTLVPAAAGPVLVAAEIEVLRALATEVNQKYAPVYDEAGQPRPWDIEFGFIDGELTLFQIRPLVERGNRNADALMRRLQPGVTNKPPASANVDLTQLPGTQAL